MDIRTVFVQEEEINRIFYLKSSRAKFQDLWSLRKAIYKLKDTTKAWYHSIMEILEELGVRK